MRSGLLRIRFSIFILFQLRASVNLVFPTISLYFYIYTASIVILPSASGTHAPASIPIPLLSSVPHIYIYHLVVYTTRRFAYLIPVIIYIRHGSNSHQHHHHHRLAPRPPPHQQLHPRARPLRHLDGPHRRDRSRRRRRQLGRPRLSPAVASRPRQRLRQHHGAQFLGRPPLRSHRSQVFILHRSRKHKH